MDVNCTYDTEILHRLLSRRELYMYDIEILHRLLSRHELYVGYDLTHKHQV